MGISQHSGAIATILAAFIGVGGAIYVAKMPDGEPSNGVDSDLASKELSDKEVFTSLSFNDVINTLKDDQLSDLQKQLFVESNDTRRVSWEVTVKNIEQTYKTNAKSDLHVVFTELNPSPELFPDFGLAYFEYTHRSKLAALSKGDKAVIEGDLNFYLSGSSWGFSLNNSELVKFTKSPQ